LKERKRLGDDVALELERLGDASREGDAASAFNDSAKHCMRYPARWHEPQAERRCVPLCALRS
jgi:hypothetical protein